MTSARASAFKDLVINRVLQGLCARWEMRVGKFSGEGSTFQHCPSEAKASIWVTEQIPGGNPHRNFADAALSPGAQKGTAGGVGRACHSHRNYKHIVHSSPTKALLSPTQVCFH